MRHSNHIGKENRLLRYLASDFGVKKKPQTRQVVSSDPYTIEAPDGSTQTIQRSTTQTTAQASEAYQQQRRASTLLTAQQQDAAKVAASIADGSKTLLPGEKPYTGATSNPVGTQGTALPQFASLEDAQKAQQSYYEQNGASDPAIEAAITRMQNPDTNYGTTGLPGTGSTTDYKAMANQGLTSPYAKPTDPRNPTGYIPKGATVDANAEARAARLGIKPAADVAKEIRDKYARAGQGPTTAEQNAEIASAIAIENEKAKALQFSQGQNSQVKGDQRNSMGTTETPSPTSTMVEGLKNLVASNPDLAGYLPIIEDLAAQDLSAGAKTIYDQGVSDLAGEDLNQDGVTDGVATAASESKKLLKDAFDQDSAYNAENRDIAVEAAKIAKDMAQLEKNKFELSQLRNENVLREQNIDAEIKNRRVAAQFGINHDTNGLKWMADDIRKGNEALAYLEQSGDVQSSMYALQIGRQYNLDIKSALSTHSQNQSILRTNYAKELETIDNTVSLDAKERRKERTELDKWYWGEKSKADLQTHNDMKDITMKLLDYETERKKAEMDGLITDGDALDFSTKVETAVNGLQEVKNFKETTFFYNGMKAAANIYAADPSTKGAFDTALVKMYEKMLDPNSVVRQEEFESQLRSQGIVRGQLQKAVDAFSGGQGLDASMQAAMLNMAGGLYESAKQTTLGAIQPKLAQVGRFNKQNGADVSLDEILTPDVIEALDIPVDEYEALDAEFGIKSADAPVDYQDHGLDMTSWVTSIGTGEIMPGSPYHEGLDQYAIDIDGKIGDPVLPFVGGTVTSISKNRKGGYGISVVVTDAEGNEHLYGHLNAANVKQGQQVRPGQPIGEMGNTGNVIPGKGGDGSHLHYRISKGGVAVQPGIPTNVASTANPKEVGGAPQASPKPVAAGPRKPVRYQPTSDPSLMSKPDDDPNSIPNTVKYHAKGVGGVAKRLWTDLTDGGNIAFPKKP